MADVQLRSISKHFNGQQVLDNVNLDIASGQYLVLLGPSGCGKSTLLRMIAGLENADSGSIHLADRCVDNVPPRKRDVSFVFQQDGLYPHLSIRQSIAMGLKHLTRGERNQRINEASAMTDLSGLLERQPDNLSGGERQRAAIAKAIARRASVRLFDEPLAALDSHVRHNIQESLIAWHRQHPGTTIHVTHDGHEAMRVADEIAVLSRSEVTRGEVTLDSPGATIAQVASPSEIYRDPCNQTVAISLGTPPMSFLKARIEDGQVISKNANIRCSFDADQSLPETTYLSIGVRPESCRVVSFQQDPSSIEQHACPDDTLWIVGQLQRQYSSNGLQYGVVESGGERMTIDTTGKGLLDAQWVSIDVAQADLHLFDAVSGRSISTVPN